MRRVELALTFPLFIAACSDGGEASHLAESSWQFERIDGQRPVSDGSRIVFDGERIGVTVGCNRMGGPWRVDEDRLVAGPLTQTEMACKQPSWTQEKAVSALLVATPRVAVEGDRMTLQSGGHTAELVRRTEKNSQIARKGR